MCVNLLLSIIILFFTRVVVDLPKELMQGMFSVFIEIPDEDFNFLMQRGLLSRLPTDKLCGY